MAGLAGAGRDWQGLAGAGAGWQRLAGSGAGGRGWERPARRLERVVEVSGEAKCAIFIMFYQSKWR